MTHRGQLILLPPNRVWRTYQGGATLDRIAGKPNPEDSHFPEDWIGSVTRAIVPGREHINEGISQVLVGEETRDLKELIDSDPEYFLGAAHVAKYGVSPKLLVKFLDSAIRLHFQCHPSPEFAQKHLNSPSGKTEAYHILGVREGITNPYIYVGFQHPPTPGQLKRWIETQDVAAMERCFEKIPVKPGDTFLIPGGFPHALGEGVFMIEIQEPSDLVVRYEFERGGYVLPEAARFMNRGVDFALSLIDFTPHPRAEIEQKYRGHPRDRRLLGPNSWQETLIGPEMTPCFRVAKTYLHEAVTKNESSFYIGIITDGACTVDVGGKIHHLKRYDKFLFPAGLGPVLFEPESHAAILECYPPA